MTKPIQDERITKETNALVARLLPVMLVLSAIALITKMLLGGGTTCLLDGAALAVGGGLAVILLTAKGVWRAEDEALREIRDTCLSQAFGAMFAVLIVGEFVAAMADASRAIWYIPTVVAWLIPALILTVKTIRRGLFQWGGKKAAANGQKRLAVTTAISALFFGAVMGIDKCFVDGAFEPGGLLTVAGMAVSWGVMYYLLMSLMLHIGGKRADKVMQDAEGAEDNDATQS